MIKSLLNQTVTGKAVPFHDPAYFVAMLSTTEDEIFPLDVYPLAKNGSKLDQLRLADQGPHSFASPIYGLQFPGAPVVLPELDIWIGTEPSDWVIFATRLMMQPTVLGSYARLPFAGAVIGSAQEGVEPETTHGPVLVGGLDAARAAAFLKLNSVREVKVADRQQIFGMGEYLALALANVNIVVPAADDTRCSMLVQNLGADPVFIGDGALMGGDVLGKGYRMAPDGGEVTLPYSANSQIAIRSAGVDQVAPLGTRVLFFKAVG